MEAPSLWVVAPVLPGSSIAREAADLFAQRHLRDVEARIRALKLVTPHCQHVDGTSFAAPIVASIAACVWQAHPELSAAQVRARNIAAAVPVAGAGHERQGTGVVDAGRATG